MGYTAKFRVWRGSDADGGLQDFDVDVNDSGGVFGEFGEADFIAGGIDDCCLRSHRLAAGSGVHGGGQTGSKSNAGDSNTKISSAQHESSNKD